MKTGLTLLLISCFSIVNAQYYYNDIVSIAEANQYFKQITQQKVKKIEIQSFEYDNRPSANFELTQWILSNRIIYTKAISPAGDTNRVKKYFSNQLIQKTEDTTGSVISSVSYEYNANKKITKITSQSIDKNITTKSTEVHIWEYDSTGTPVKMINIKNGSDTTFIECIKDESGNIIEEKWKRKNRITETYYYYYNDENQLTDIVRYNNKLKRLLPDFIFEYNKQNQLQSMIQSLPNNTNYLHWKYSYDSTGLKTREELFNKKKELVGYMIYKYEFN